MSQIYWDILDQNRLDLWKKMGFITKAGFYLAGGTAMALQVGHRTSVDFDFYNLMVFDPARFGEVFTKEFPEAVIQIPAHDTLFAEVNQVQFSFFPYSYKFVRPLVLIDPVEVSSLADIAAMKCIAITQRAKKRDFIDLYYLLQKYSINQILDFVTDKFPNYDPYHVVVALNYFAEAESDQEVSRFRLTDSKLSWEEVKKTISNEVREYQLAMK